MVAQIAQRWLANHLIVSAITQQIIYDLKGDAQVVSILAQCLHLSFCATSQNCSTFQRGPEKATCLMADHLDIVRAARRAILDKGRFHGLAQAQLDAGAGNDLQRASHPLGGYPMLFVVGIVFAILAAIAIVPIRGVK